MRRAPLILTGTALGVAGVLTFHPRTPELPAATAASPAAAAAPTTSSSSSTTASSAAGSSSSSGSTTSSSGSTTDGTFTGTAIATQYGNAQVRVTISGGKITKDQALQLQGNDPKSVQISSSAEPTLRQEVLQKQTAAVDAVSGATFTSASYKASLQSALDKAGFTSADGQRAATSPTFPQGQGGH